MSFEFSPFFEMAPDMLRLPLVILATAATVIASQAVISGAFSLTQQAIQLGLLPRMEIRRTSETQAGQIYMPQINWLLLAGVLVLTLAFGSSTRLAAAYGISITGEMLMSTCMMFIVIWKLWKRPIWLAALIVAPFVVIELIFLSSNLQRVVQGGFVPLLLAGGLVIVMWTWVRGTRILADTMRRDEPLAKLFETLSHHPPHRVRGAAIFLTGDPDIAPAALMHNLKHNQVLHEQIIILTVKTLNTPRAPESERVKVEDFLPDVKRVALTFGFMETPNVVKALTEARKHGLKFDIMKTSFFLRRRTIVPSEQSGMPLWQDHLFIFLARNATNATDFFHIPSRPRGGAGQPGDGVSSASPASGDGRFSDTRICRQSQTHAGLRGRGVFSTIRSDAAPMARSRMRRQGAGHSAGPSPRMSRAQSGVMLTAARTIRRWSVRDGSSGALRTISRKSNTISERSSFGAIASNSARISAAERGAPCAP